MTDTSTAPAPEPTAAAPYTSDIFVTWRVLGPRTDEAPREPVGWAATDAVRAFGLTDGDDAWTEDADLVGYHFGTIDDGTVAVRADLPDGLPPLPIGPNADPNAKLAPPPGDDAGDLAGTITMFVENGRAALDAARGKGDTAAPAAPADPAPTEPAPPVAPSPSPGMSAPATPPA